MLGLIVCSAVLAANPPSNPPETYAEARGECRPIARRSGPTGVLV